MNIWEILEIDVTCDTGIIKKAYRAKLKTTRPDDDGDAFMRLRSAYEEALEYAEKHSIPDDDFFDDEDIYSEPLHDNIFGDQRLDITDLGRRDLYDKDSDDNEFYYEDLDNEDLDNNDFYEDAYTIEVSEDSDYTQGILRHSNDDGLRHIGHNHRDIKGTHKNYKTEDSGALKKPHFNKEKFGEWTERIDDLYDDYNRRNQVSEWRALISDDIPYQIEYYNECRKYIKQLVYDKYKRLYLPKEVRMFIEQFFSYAKTPVLRASIGDDDEREALNEFNRRIKLCENIEFYKLNPYDTKGTQIDEFFSKYEELIQKLVRNQRYNAVAEGLAGFSVSYLPFECIYTYLHLQELSESEVTEKIAELENSFGSQVEIEILKVQYMVHTGDAEGARAQLRELYKNAPLKNYPALYQMAVCCINVSMYYEAYMLVKQLAWLNPEAYIHDMAEDISRKLENQYMEMTESGEEPDDIWHIRICRMYLRGNREKEAVEILKRVKDTAKYQWEYEVAHAMCIFYEDSLKTTSDLYIIGILGDAEPPMDIADAKPVFEILEAYPKENLSNVERLEWQELQGRYLFEQRRHKECEALCNELLEEYPLRLLRKYIWKKFKVYPIYGYVISYKGSSKEKGSASFGSAGYEL